MVDKHRLALGMGLALAVSLLEVSAHGDATGVVLKRHSLMDDIREAGKEISEMMRGKRPLIRDELAHRAAHIAKLAGSIVELFPDTKMSRHGAGSNATQSTWSEFGRFTKMSDTLIEEAAALAEAANAAPEADLRAGFEAVSETCRSCHESYRKKRKRH